MNNLIKVFIAVGVSGMMGLTISKCKENAQLKEAILDYRSMLEKSMTQTATLLEELKS